MSSKKFKIIINYYNDIIEAETRTNISIAHLITHEYKHHNCKTTHGLANFLIYVILFSLVHNGQHRERKHMCSTT